MGMAARLSKCTPDRRLATRPLNYNSDRRIRPDVAFSNLPLRLRYAISNSRASHRVHLGQLYGEFVRAEQRIPMLL